MLPCTVHGVVAGPDRRRSGFTLIEILLALGVMALVIALVAPSLGSVFQSLDHEEPGEILWTAVTAARERALTSNRPVFLRYDRRTERLAWGDNEADSRAWPAGVELRLLRPEMGATVLMGGRLVETEQVDQVRFYPDGTCDRFRVSVATTGGPVRVLAIDPWTCAPELTGGEKR